MNTKKIEAPYYPIVYVRGYAMRAADQEETFHDAYYGFSASSVEIREASPKNGYQVVDIFEGQMIRFMKMREYRYADSVNYGLNDFNENKSRSIWISRFYDQDVIQGKRRTIIDHATDLARLIIEEIPEKLKSQGIENIDTDYKVILIAHSMGGLVCRALIQTILKDYASKSSVLPPAKYKDASAIIHKLVTMGTPHNGIDMGNVPDWLENSIIKALNPYDAGIFKAPAMRKYLSLNTKQAINSLGDSQFSIEKCLCVIGSDYLSYGDVKTLTGSYSDGLVKQENAFLISDTDSKGGIMPVPKKAYTANVHRAHSGNKGIVNSIETYENVQRFLFGDMKVNIALTDVEITTKQESNIKYFYDFEFALSIRGTGVFLHRREQEPCGNAYRYDRSKVPQSLQLHTAFLNSSLNIDPKDPFSYFVMKFKVFEFRTEDGFLWDYKYPSREIFAESLEIQICKNDDKSYAAGFRWLSEVNWNMSALVMGETYKIPLRDTPSIKGFVELSPNFFNNEY
nr:hypothetical protein [Pedobacter panaciterrae]